MKPILLGVLLFPLCACAQFFGDGVFLGASVSSVSVPFSPTNTGYPSIAWYVAGDYSTNGTSFVQLPDRWTNSWTLTNANLENAWPVYTNSLALPTLYFDGTTNFLKSVLYTSSQPHEVAMLMRFRTIPASKYVFDSTVSSGARNAFFTGSSANKLAAYAGSSITEAAFAYSNWMVFNVLFNGANSYILTNGATLSGPLDAGTQADNGFTLGAKNDRKSEGNIEVAEVSTYGAALSGAARTNLWKYWFDKYGLTSITATATNAASPLTTPTFDGSGQVVHPDIQYVPGGWGTENVPYWMAIDPFTNANNLVETPSILCSEDGITWTVPDGLVNPVVPLPPEAWQVNSDPDLLIWTNGIAYLHYGFQTSAGSGTNTVYRYSSSDGVTWTGPVYVTNGLESTFRSPAVVWNGSQCVMVWHDQVADKIKYATCATPYGTWSAASEISGFTGSAHQDVLWDSPKYWMVRMNTDSKLELHWSTNLTTWTQTIPATLLQAGSAGAWDSEKLYRSTFIKTPTGFTLWYGGVKNETTHHVWKIGLTSIVTGTYP